MSLVRTETFGPLCDCTSPTVTNVKKRPHGWRRDEDKLHPLDGVTPSFPIHAWLVPPCHGKSAHVTSRINLSTFASSQPIQSQLFLVRAFFHLPSQGTSLLKFFSAVSKFWRIKTSSTHSPTLILIHFPNVNHFLPLIHIILCLQFVKSSPFITPFG